VGDADHPEERDRAPHQPGADATTAPVLPDAQPAQLGPTGHRGQAAAAGQVGGPLDEADLHSPQLGEEALPRLVGDRAHLQAGHRRHGPADLGQDAAVQDLLVGRLRLEPGPGQRRRDVRPALGDAAHDGHGQRRVARVQPDRRPARRQGAGGVDQRADRLLRLGPEQQPRQLGCAAIADPHVVAIGVADDVRGAH
jgi:hypothetical protein